MSEKDKQQVEQKPTEQNQEKNIKKKKKQLLRKCTK